MPADQEFVAQRNHETLLSVRQVVASYAIYWHKLAVDSTIFIVTGSIALAGFSLSRSGATKTMLVSICVILCIMCWSGAYLVHLIEKKTAEHQSVLVRLDRLHGLLEPGVFVPGESIYPDAWRSTGTEHAVDPIFRFCLGLLAVLPILLSVLVVANGWS